MVGHGSMEHLLKLVHANHHTNHDKHTTNTTTTDPNDPCPDPHNIYCRDLWNGTHFKVRM
jgi:hypothetical protein